MDTSHEFLVVGGGLAGASAIEGIRERDRSSSILLLTSEPDPPYDRPPLTKDLWFGKKKVDEVFLHDAGFYAAHGVEMILGRTAAELDARTHSVVDDTGDRHSYRKLLLATGGVPRRLDVPGGALGGLCYYRTLRDYRHVSTFAKKGRAAVVIGGGFIGSELAAALVSNDFSVTIVFPGRFLAQRALPEALARVVMEKYAAHGVRVLAGDVPAAIVQSGRRYSTITRNGEKIEADLVVVGVGIEPSIALAQLAGLSVGDGIVVDDRLRTSHPDIYAAGDNACFPYAALGRSVRVEHWDNALEQGKHAGRNMAGADEPYTHMPYFFSDLFDFGYEAVGDVDARLETIADWQEPFTKGVVYYVGGGRVRGAMMCNVWGKVDAARALIREGASAADVKGAIR